MAPLLNNLLVNADIYLAQRRPGSDRRAGNAVSDVFGELTWLNSILAILGGVLFIWMLLKFIISRSKGTASGGSMIGQLAMGIFGLMILFNPTFLYSIADGAMVVFRSVFDMFAGGFS